MQVTRLGMALGLSAWCLRLLLLCTGLLFAYYLVTITATEWLYSPAFTTMAHVAQFPYMAQALAYSHAFIPEYQEFATAVRYFLPSKRWGT
jgi:hypothetical protein